MNKNIKKYFSITILRKGLGWSAPLLFENPRSYVLFSHRGLIKLRLITYALMPHMATYQASFDLSFHLHPYVVYVRITHSRVGVD